MADPVKAVVFDFGGVFTPSPFHAVGQVARDLGTTRERLLEVVFGPYSSDTDHPWHKLERGEVSMEEAREAILGLGAERGFDADVYTIFAQMGSAGSIRPEFVEHAREARQGGRRVGLLTNNVAELREHWRKMLPVDELFDDVVDSSEVGMRKPDPRIFALACARLGVDPSQAVFLDDHEGNVAASRRAGLVGVLVDDDGEAALDELRRLLAG